MLKRGALVTSLAIIGISIFFLLRDDDTLPTPLQTCPDDVIAELLSLLGDYTPSDMHGFVYLDNDQFILNDTPYEVKGINYYPANYPWRRFLTETNLDELRAELTLLRDTGFNTLRIFLWNTALFNCPGSGAVPNWGVFQRLDGIILTAAELDFHLIVTLNDLPDLTDYPLYNNPQHIQEQTRFIIERYRDEAAILAWDLRNEADIDYGSKHGDVFGDFSKSTVLNWLEETAIQVREWDDNYLITIGWLNDAEATAPYVDFISFHHWEGVDELIERIDKIHNATDKPILLQEFGYSDYHENITPERQAELINDVIDVSENQGLLGWMIWTAFDFPLEATCIPSPCRSEDNAEHHFGIWGSDYNPKPAVQVILSLINY